MIKINMITKMIKKKLKSWTLLLLNYHFFQLLFNRPANTIRSLR